MYKIIGGDRKEYGPVTADELRAWVAEGRLNGQSLAQAEGEQEWKPLASMAEFAAALSAQAGHAGPAATAAAPIHIEVWTAEVLTRRPEVRVGQCLAQSWSLLTANFGLLFGATFLVWMISLIIQLIPVVGMFYPVIWGVLYGGLYLVFLNRIRGRPASVGDVFAGFSASFAQLLLAGFVSVVLTVIGLLPCCLIVPGLFLFVAWIFSVPLVADKRLEFWSAMELSRKVVTRVWFEMFGLILLVFLPVILAFLVVEIKIILATSSAMREILASGRPDFARLLTLMMQVTRENFLLILLPKVILLLNLPFALGALMYAYENLFGTRSAPAR